MKTTTPEKCPKCGAEFLSSSCGMTTFYCGSRNSDPTQEAVWLQESAACVRSQRDQLAERVRMLEACRSWRPIQTCPHNLEWVLGYDEKDGEIGMIIYDWETTADFTMRSWTDGRRTWTPTHWMPLPEPPKEKGAQ